MRTPGSITTQKKTPPARSPYSREAIKLCCRCSKHVTEYGDVRFQQAECELCSCYLIRIDNWFAFTWGNGHNRQSCATATQDHPQDRMGDVPEPRVPLVLPTPKPCGIDCYCGISWYALSTYRAISTFLPVQVTYIVEETNNVRDNPELVPYHTRCSSWCQYYSSAIATSRVYTEPKKIQFKSASKQSRTYKGYCWT